MKHLFWALLIGPMALFAQEKGIVFTQNLTWQDILDKAKAENKYIFVDCFATWCEPCKYMEKNVYTNDTVGDLMREKFICVKVQMDTSNKDDAWVQKWYSTAHWLGVQCNVQAYPSYLFFSPYGKLVHGGVGGKEVQVFLALVEAAVDAQKQYYTLLDNYRHGNKEYDVLPYLANISGELGDEGLFQIIARDYIQHLQTVPEERLWTKENIGFIVQCSRVLSSKDFLFQRYYRARRVIDSIMEKSGYTDGLINTIAYREDVKSYVDQGIKEGREPNWHRMEKRIEKSYGLYYVEKNVVRGRVVYYRERKQWESYAKYFFRQAQDKGIQTWEAIGLNGDAWNNYAYEIFKYSKDRRELETALNWVERALAIATKPNANMMDTKANLLYKLGRRDEGLALESQSCRLAPTDEEIQANFEKMRKGLPTWINK